MKKYIVTTTINVPSMAIKKFASMRDWRLIVVGDKKTPHDSYASLNLDYLSPEYQESNYQELSEAIGWNCIQRRNIGFVEAYKRGADIVATVDDDNIPYDDWGKDLYVGYTINVDSYTLRTGIPVFNPLSLTNYPELWHRGFPLECLRDSKPEDVAYLGKEFREILIQADFWDGALDVDAVCRKMYRTDFLKLEIESPFTPVLYSPFDSQNTFLARNILPNYMVLPHIGRMDDIWGGYIAQYLTGTRPLYNYSTVYQERNVHSLNKDFENETIGYLHTVELVYNIESYEKYIPQETVNAFNLYRKEYGI